MDSSLTLYTAACDGPNSLPDEVVQLLHDVSLLALLHLAPALGAQAQEAALGDLQHVWNNRNVRP